jgi:hypothetical protein
MADETLIGKLVQKDPARLMRNKKSFSEGTIAVAAKELIVGLELEIEAFPTHKEFAYGGMTFSNDNSLRNGGIEVITEPVHVKHVENLLAGFFKHFGITEENYSERCSLHVHMNVCDITVDHLASLALLYQLFERGLFTYIGHGRGNNIFCVPWCQANINVNLVNVIRKQDWYSLRNWQKYTALNLLPIQHQGTVEFRHLHGTCDVAHIVEWLNLIGSMYNYAMKTPVDELQELICALNTNSAYEVFLNAVFGEYAKVLTAQPDFHIAMEQGVIDCKLMLTSPEGLVKVSKAKRQPSARDDLEQAIADLRNTRVVPGQLPRNLNVNRIVMDELADPPRDDNVTTAVWEPQWVNVARVIPPRG